jgi:hypothetical protein
MSVRSWSALSLMAVVAGTLAFSRRPPDPPAAPTPPREQSTTLDDQTDLAVTVYNSSLALVRDVRTVRLASGPSHLDFMDIAATVNPATVHLRSLTDPASLSVLEQNYEYDLLDPEKLLHKYVGRDVTLIRTVEDATGSHEATVTARLLSDNGAPVWRIDGAIVTGLRADSIRFSEMPGNLYSRPTLIWTLDNRGATSQRIEASYLASQLSWNADYVLTVARDDRHADLDGWVTVSNGSGTSFRNARLQLVAGDVHRVQKAVGRTAVDEVAAARPAPPPMAEESFSDYHLYTLGRRTTINNSETKQVSLLEATGFPIQKRYVVDGQAYYYRNALHPGAPIKDVVQVYYQFRNDTAGSLGMPMPAGTIRVYQADSSGSLQFVGEDRIDHTPKDETLNLKIGDAFDVVCERRQTDFERIAPNVYELAYEITLRNHKTTPVTVEVNEPVGGTWRMLQSTRAWTKTDAWAAQFQVPVAANGASTLRYRMRITY